MWWLWLQGRQAGGLARSPSQFQRGFWCFVCLVGGFAVALVPQRRLLLGCMHVLKTCCVVGRDVSLDAKLNRVSTADVVPLVRLDAR